MMDKELEAKCLLIDDDIGLLICSDCPQENVFIDQQCNLCLQMMMTVSRIQLAKAEPLIRADERETVLKENQEAINDYEQGKISFERMAERLGINFYSLANLKRR